MKQTLVSHFLKPIHTSKPKSAQKTAHSTQKSPKLKPGSTASPVVPPPPPLVHTKLESILSPLPPPIFTTTPPVLKKKITKTKPKLRSCSSTPTNSKLENIGSTTSPIVPPPLLLENEKSKSSKKSKKSKKRKVKNLGPSEYELARLEKIKQNQQVLQSLGLMGSVSKPAISLAVTPKPTIKRLKKNPKVTLTRNYGLRSKGKIESIYDKKKEKIRPPSPEIIYTYDDSNVIQYQCTETNSTLITRKEQDRLKGWNFSPEEYIDPVLNKTYSISFDCRWGSLIAAAGHAGRLSVWGRKEKDSVLSWKGHRGWISDVNLVKSIPMSLLSSSNDGSVSLWNLSKCREEGRSIIPPLLYSTSNLHQGHGIFSMDVKSNQILTSSKDGTVAISQLTSNSIELIHVFNESNNVIKSAKFQQAEANSIAIAGNDKNITLIDPRLASTHVLTINQVSHTAINALEWNPIQIHLLLSASFDQEILLHDIRKSQKPIYTYKGHVHPNVGRCGAIYHPYFCDKGNGIVTPGIKTTSISLYNVVDGSTISRGDIGFEARSIAVDPQDQLITAFRKDFVNMEPRISSVRKPFHSHTFSSRTISSNLILRPIRITDYEKGICDTLEQLTSVGSVKKEEFEERFVEWSLEPDTYYIFVIEDIQKKVIIAAATLFVEKKLTHQCGKVGHIEDVVVRKEYRAKQLGIKLIEMLKQVGEKVGCYKIILDCSEKNIAFYKRCGMHKKEIQMAYYISLNKNAKL